MSSTEQPKPDVGPASAPEDKAEAPSGLKLLIELGPLGAFAVAYVLYGLKPATGVLMVTSVAAIIAARMKFGVVAPMLYITAVISVICGALVFLLDDPRFIKVKPTAVNLLFAGALLFGIWRGQLLLQHLLGSALQLTETGWRLLTWRWIGFFLVMAAANEVVWRNFSDGTWVTFKLLVVAITFVFAIAQIGLIKTHSTATEDAGPG